MYQYRQIIFRLRQGDTIRGIAQSKLAGRKKLRQIRDIAIRQDWLNPDRNLPSEEELSSVFNLNSKYPKQSSAEPYRNQIELWVKQGIQTSTIHAALQRQYEFSSSYHATLRLVNQIKETIKPMTTMLDFQPGECAQVDLSYCQFWCMTKISSGSFPV